jgi:indolepyruvate ferredoxin oxidoreductase, beta subunit
MSAPPRPITMLLCALGGEGGGVLAEWLVDAARHAGLPAQSTSIPGVAQRTGATTYYLEIYPLVAAQSPSANPIFSLNPVPGALDVLVSSELLETVRQASNGMVSPARTRVITSSARALTTHERMQMGDGRVDHGQLRKVVELLSQRCDLFDMNALAQQHGTVVSAVMLGAIAGSGVLPVSREIYEAVIRKGERGVEASLRGFAAAYTRLQTGVDAKPHTQEAPAVSHSLDPRAAAFPAAAQATIALGIARMEEYQGAAYASLYLQRLQRVLDAENTKDASAVQGHAITTETARWLALWMAFDDIVRVADLKARASRAARVHAEVKAEAEQIVRVYDHFKPGVPEFAAMLPDALATRLLRWDTQRQQKGLPPFALKLKVRTDGVVGMLALRALAGMKSLRPHGSRYAQEQALIEAWLKGVTLGTRAHWPLGHELAQCGRLIKGYGSTNERGKANLLHILEHLAIKIDFPSLEDRTTAIAQARKAALADEAGTALDAALVQHGAPARAIKAQAIRWMRKPAPSVKA